MLVSYIIILVYFSFVFVARNKRINDLLLILITSVFVVSIFFPILSYFEDPLTWRNLYGLSIEKIEYVQLQYLSFILGTLLFYFSWGWKLDNYSRVKVIKINQKERSSLIDKTSFFSIVLILFGSILYIIYIKSVGFETLVASEALTDKYKASSGKGFLYIGFNFIIWGILIGETTKNNTSLKLISRLLAFFVIIWALFFIHTRTYVAILIFGYFYIYVEKYDIKIINLKFKYVFIAIFGWLFLEIFVMARGLITTDVNFADIFKMGLANIELAISNLAGSSDFSHPFITFFELTRNEEPGAMLGSGILDGIISLLPSFILDEKPKTMAEWFVTNYYPGLKEIGGGTGSSFVGELWLNFGSFIAPFIVGFLLSFFLYLIQKKANEKNNGLIALSIPYFVFSLFFLERMGLVASMKQFIYMYIPFVLIFITFKILSHSNSK